MNMGFVLTAFLAIYSSEVSFASDGRCQMMDAALFAKQSQKWAGRELLAFASWCSSCKPKVLEAKLSPNNFVLIAAFDEVEAVERTLKKLKIDAPCIYGESLVEHLGISMLPWSKKI